MQEREKPSFKRKIDAFLFGWIINWAYPQYYRPKYTYLSFKSMFFEFFIPQKIRGINRKVKWPVHPTSKIVCPENIKKGVMTDPGDSIGVYIQAYQGIEFGHNVAVSPGVKIISSNHNTTSHTQHQKSRPIIIGNNVWIGANAVILPGIHIGDNVTIGAGSVVTKDIPSNSIAVGNPCQVIKEKGPNQVNLKDVLFNRKLPNKFSGFTSPFSSKKD